MGAPMKHLFAKRGFITIATGNLRYYSMALNLLHSYRFHAKSPYPFAILCDRANAITAEFDHVIILTAPTNSYNDKLKLFDYLPYEETIFIDADSLAYGDLNTWFDLFEKQGDFSCFGYANRDLSTQNGWFSRSGMKEYKEQISFIPSFNGGVYYLRNTPTCHKVFSIAQNAAKNYSDYSFRLFRSPADEPVLALGMAVCGCEPLNANELVFAPKNGSMELDIISGKARNKNHAHDYKLVHWSNYRTLKSDYQLEIRKLACATEKGRSVSFFHKCLYEYGFARVYLWIYDVSAFLFRVRRVVKKKWVKKLASKSFFSLKR